MKVKRFFVGMFCVMCMTLAVIFSACASSSTSSAAKDSVTLKNKVTGKAAVLDENGYYILDEATVLYENLSADEEEGYIYTCLLDDDNNPRFLPYDDEYADVYHYLISVYDEDRDTWGFDISEKKGSVYQVEFRDQDNRFLGIVAYFSILGEARMYVVLLD